MDWTDLTNEINVWGVGSFLEYSLIETIFFILFIAICSKIVLHVLRKFISRKHYTNAQFIERMIKIIVYIVAAYGIFNLFVPFQNILTALAAGGGILAVVIGFAAQEAMGNVVNGLMITVFKPFKIGDLIKVNKDELVGFVVDISLRHTVIKTYENTKIIIPNSVMNKAVLENVTSVGDHKANFLEFEVGYECNLDVAMNIIEHAVIQHENYLDIRSEEEIAKGIPAVVTRLMAFNESGMSLRTTVYSKNNAEGFAMLSDLRIAIKKQFDAVGINIPYPHRTILYKNDENTRK